MNVVHGSRKSLGFRFFVLVWRGYTYFYYRIYTWELKLWDESSAKWAAMYLVAIVSWINLYTIVGCIWGFNNIYNQPKSLYFLTSIIWFWLNYKALLSRGKYKKIVARFSNESESKRKTNTWFCFLYPVLSFVALTLVSFIR